MRRARVQTRPLRFRRSVVRDLRNRIRIVLVGLLILIGLHAAAMIAFERLRLGEAVWLTFDCDAGRIDDCTARDA